VSENPRSYTTVDVAKRLGVSLQTIQRWVDAGHLKAWKTPGGHRRIDAASAEALIAEQRDRLGAPTPSASAPESDAPPAPTVVIVDDDPLDRALLVLLAERALPEAAVRAATNGFEGLVAIGQLAPVVVVTDIHMPHMDGFEMIRTLMIGNATPPRLLVAVSALTRAELAEKGELPPDVLVLTKPIDQQRFVDALRSAMDAGGAGRAAA